jgi:hypothetical protein
MALIAGASSLANSRPYESSISEFDVVPAQLLAARLSLWSGGRDKKGKEKKAKLRRPYSLRRGGAGLFRPRISKERGAERRQALAGKRRARGPPRGRTDLGIARDHRPMTPAGTPLGAPPRHFSVSGPRFRLPAFTPGRQPAPGGGIVVSPGRSPGAARVRGDELRPQGPHPVPLSRRLMKTPSVDRMVLSQFDCGDCDGGGGRHPNFLMAPASFIVSCNGWGRSAGEKKVSIGLDRSAVQCFKIIIGDVHIRNS